VTDQATGLIDAQGQRHTRAEGPVRIVSLVPSITELLCALGLAGALVGRTGFCVHPREIVRGVRKLGGTKDVDLEALSALAPTHVVVNIDENTRETYLKLRERVPHVIVTHPNAPQDNPGLYRLLGGIFGREAETARLCEAFAQAEARLERAASGLAPRRVLYLIWRRPWMTVARDTYISAMLRRVRWFTVPVVTSSRYPELSDPELGELGAELCLLSSEPYAFRARHIDEVRALLGASTPVRLIDGEMMSWYGSRAIPALDYLARFAHDATAHAA